MCRIKSTNAHPITSHCLHQTKVPILYISDRESQGGQQALLIKISGTIRQ